MMKLSRRTFLKGSSGVTGSLLVSYYGVDQFIPDGAPSPSAAESSAATLTEEWVPTTCWIGKQDCGMLARLINGRLVKLEGNPAHPRNVGGLCPKGVGQIQAIYDPRRVKTPLKRTNEKGVSGELASHLLGRSAHACGQSDRPRTPS